MESMRKAPRLKNQEDEGEKTLDADLWGQLQEYLPLHNIYEKLLQQDLLRLRLVSKEWNLAALQWILPEPSFVTIAARVDAWYGDAEYLNGILTYNSVSGKFKFNRQHLCMPDVQTHVPPFEVEGLIVCHNPDNLDRGVFNVHTRTWHAIPTGPKQSESLSICGLLVDTTLRPYTFKLIEGNSHFKTQIYDSKSRSWSTTSSQLSSSYAKSWLFSSEYSCICHNFKIYIYGGTHMILKYSLENDEWTELKSPTLSHCGHETLENTLQIWKGRIFTLGIWKGRIFALGKGRIFTTRERSDFCLGERSDFHHQGEVGFLPWGKVGFSPPGRAT